jgi:acetyl esterase/lipase
VPSLSCRLIFGYLRMTRANRIYTSPDQARTHIEQRSIRPRRYGPPQSLRSDVTVAVEDRQGWPVYSLTPASGEIRGDVVYIHGGGWVNEIARQHWQLAAQIAAEAGMSVIVPIYPLVPFGTAEHVVSAIADLVHNMTKTGSTCLAGDSAGGQIALSAAVVLRDRFQVTLPRTVLIAPALDLSLANPEIARVQPSDPWLGRDGLQVLVECWRGSLAITDPRVSPLAADLHGLGPLIVFSGTRDILNPDARLLVRQATSAGVDVDYHEGAGLPHVYPLTPTPEGRAARALLVARLRAAQVLSP